MIVLFTDFGRRGPYTGQMRAVLEVRAPGVPVVELMGDAPAFSPAAAGHLLAALVAPFPPGSVFLCVVDPGVGTTRDALYLEIDGRWYVGPDNGLFDVLAKRAAMLAAWRIDWRPESLSESFHGRDLFAPAAAWLALGESFPATPLDAYPRPLEAVADDLEQVIYVDEYGNAVTGVRAASAGGPAMVAAGGRRLAYARTFGEAPPGAVFWYRNSMGLVEIAVNQGSAAEVLGLRIGDAVSVS